MAEFDSAPLLRDAARATLRYLETSVGWQRLKLAEGDVHIGDDPILADAEAHRVFQYAVSAHPDAAEAKVFAVVGEEAMLSLPESYVPGTRVIVVDPLDGSTQWALVSTAFCVAAYCLVARDTDGSVKLEIESVVIVNPQHTFTWRASSPSGVLFGTTRTDGADDVLLLDPLPETQLDQPSVAFTGFKTKDREALIAISSQLAAWQIITIGGNPVTPYVLAAGLTAAVTLRPQAAWDALGILLASKAGAAVGFLNGQLVESEWLHDLFVSVVLDQNVRRIPALIVAKSEERYREVTRGLMPLIDGGLISPYFPKP